MPQPTSDEDDAALVARCRVGDGAAWTVLVHRYQRLVYAIVRRMGLDEHTAADVFQTVFARLMENLPRIADPQRLQAWIVTTARREALLTLRHSQRLVSMTQADDGDDDERPDWDLADDSPSAEQQLGELQQLHQVRNAFERLDERCRDLLGLVFRDADETLGYDEIARRLGTPIGSIGPTRSRCLDKLRRLVA
jgi:RNA polymerase sigma factor (sigma-70 family)